MSDHTHHSDPSADGRPGTGFDRRLRSRLQADPVDLPEPAGPDRAISRAGRRRTRRAVVASAAALALVGAVVGQALLDEPDRAQLAAGGPVADGVELDWQVNGDGLSRVHTVAPSSESVYVLSTAPGTRWKDHPDGDVPQALYHLAEDGSWTPVELTEDDPRISHISERDGTLYAMSTAAGTRTPTGSVSTDGGESWTSVQLAGVEPPSDAVAWGLSYSTRVASTDDVTLALVTARFSLPYDELFGDTLDSIEAPYHILQDEDGVSLVEFETEEEILLSEAGEEALAVERDAAAAGAGPTTTVAPDLGAVNAQGSWPRSETGAESGEVLETVGWDELGVSGPDDLVGPTIAYLVDGESWTEIDGPAELGDGVTTALHSAGDSIVLATSSPTSAEAFRTTDGTDWQPVSTPGVGPLAAAPGGALVQLAASQSGEAPTLQMSRDAGVSWTPLDLGTVDERFARTGPGAFHTVSGGPLGVAILVGPGEGDPGEDMHLLFSTDLAGWSVTNLSELSPESSYFDQVTVGNDRIVVNAFGEPGDAEAPGETRTLIATPARG